MTKWIVCADGNHADIRTYSEFGSSAAMVWNFQQAHELRSGYRSLQISGKQCSLLSGIQQKYDGIIILSGLSNLAGGGRMKHGEIANPVAGRDPANRYMPLAQLIQ